MQRALASRSGHTAAQHVHALTASSRARRGGALGTADAALRPLIMWLDVRGSRVSGVMLLLGAVAIVAGCGAARQDAHEAKGKFPVRVLSASFPAHQSIAKPATFELRVQNTGTHTVPNIAVTVDSFSYASTFAGLASPQRPIWVIEEGPGSQPSQPVESEQISPPGGGQTAYVNTWAVGPLAPESSQVFEWHVMPVKPGRYTVHYTIGAGLAGKARAVTSSGGAVVGELTADIAARPPARHVNPATGRVEPGQFPKHP
jgi:hypothetical protein